MKDRLRLTSAIVFVLWLALCCTSCVTQKNVVLQFNPATPLRIAVLPFYQTNSDGEFIYQETAVPIPASSRPSNSVTTPSSSLDLPPTAIIQRYTERALSHTAFELVDPATVRSELVAHGYISGDHYDYRRLNSEPAATLCRILGCDAVFTGQVIRWQQTYLGIESVSTVELRFSLVKASNNQLLYSATIHDSSGRGVTKIPTGYASLILEPLRGLGSQEIENLAASVVVQAIEPLFTKEHPEFAQREHPKILAAAHDAAQGIVSQSLGMTVLLVATPGGSATFQIGDTIEEVPMQEVSAGHYRGIYVPLPEDSFTSSSVTVRIEDQFQRVDSAVVPSGAVSLQPSAQ